MKKITGAEAVIRSLIAEDVQTIFGYPGGAIMPIYDALYDYADRINHILVRHEQGAAHAAQGYARATGKPGICFATSGPGATNLITGLADAMMDSTPIICITGQVSSKLLGTDAFQETDVIGISMPVTKWNIQVTKSEEIPEAIAKAFYIASTGRPGPVLIDITKDAQFGQLDFDYTKCHHIRSYFPHPDPDKKALKQAAELLNKAKKPMMLVGHGIVISGASKQLLKFVEKSGVPVASTLLGLGAFPANHPQYIGYLGMHGNYAPNIQTNEADLLFAVGMRFDDRVTGDVSRYAPKAKVVHIDIDPAELNKTIKAEVAIHADAKEALQDIMKHIKTVNHSKWIAQFHELSKMEYKEVIAKDIAVQNTELKMSNVIRMLSDKTKGEAIIVSDVGQHQMVVSRYYKYREGKNNVTSGGLGTMGFALPAAIGAKIGVPKKEVIAVIGDGGFQMTLQELGVILQYKIDVKILILNNNFLGMVRQWQQLFFDNRYSFTEMVNPDFVAIAKAYKVAAAKVTKPSEIGKALDAMLKHKGSYLLEVVVEKEENVFPMVATGASVSEIRLK
jgi:acetolactate synthase-1/2/3 large subunit